MAGSPIRRPTDPAQESLVGALRTGFNVLRVLMFLFLVAYALSGIFRVETGEQGLIVRLGKLVRNPETNSAVHQQGWQLALPDPFDEKIRIPGKSETLVVDTFCFLREDSERGKPLSSIEKFKDRLFPGVDGAMITGDQNLAHGLWKIEYRIGDAEAFVRRIGERLAAVEPLLQRLAEDSVIREVAWRRFEDLTRGDVGAVAAAVRDRLNRRVKALELGVEIVSVVAETVEPLNVRDAYRAVSQAENEKKKVEEEARAEASRVLNEAAGPQYPELLQQIREYGAAQVVDAVDAADLAQRRAEIERQLERAGGRVASMLRTSAAAANEYRERLKVEADEFRGWSRLYAAFPELTRLRLWNTAIGSVLNTSRNELFFLSDSDKLEFLINRDPSLSNRRQVEALQSSNQPR